VMGQNPVGESSGGDSNTPVKATVQKDTSGVDTSPDRSSRTVSKDDWATPEDAPDTVPAGEAAAMQAAVMGQNPVGESSGGDSNTPVYQNVRRNTSKIDTGPERQDRTVSEEHQGGRDPQRINARANKTVLNEMDYEPRDKQRHKLDKDKLSFY
ncbi:MAG: hypothetical protein ABEN55_21000, partial [Bradymonadaceae bacterium]